MLQMPAVAPEPYFLTSERLGFRCWSPADLPIARELWGDPEVTRFFGGPFCDEVVAQKLATEIDRMHLHDFQYWPIYLREGHEHVGCCGLRPYRPEQKVPELGFHLRPKFWGRGLAVEACKTVIVYAFATLRAAGLAAGHHPDNVNSKKVLAKLNFRYSHDEFFPELNMHIPYYFLRSG
jgi:[ribosomal protein S5]-alanine N-acetyltransferase